jgi:hypothetical protein
LLNNFRVSQIWWGDWSLSENSDSILKFVPDPNKRFNQTAVNFWCDDSQQVTLILRRRIGSGSAWRVKGVCIIVGEYRDDEENPARPLVLLVQAGINPQSLNQESEDEE